MIWRFDTITINSSSMKKQTIQQAVKEADELLKQPEHGPLSAVMIAASALGDDERNYYRVRNAFVRKHPRYAKAFEPLPHDRNQLHFSQLGSHHD